MRRLLDRLQQYETHTKPRYQRQFASLASGQAPLALFVTCADSRIVPSLIASSQPGELFVVRNIANLIPVYADEGDPSVPAAIAYAVDTLQVHDIIVCGHSNCGGIRALMEGSAEGPLRRWLEHAQPALERCRGTGGDDAALSPHDRLSQTSTLLQVENLRSYPSVRKGIHEGTVRLHAWWFDIARGNLLAHWGGRFIPALEELARIEAQEAAAPPSSPQPELA